MSLLTTLVTLPLAPVRGVMRLAEVLEQAEAEMNDPRRIAVELQSIADDVAAGEMTEEEATEREEELIHRLNIGREPETQGG